MKISGFLGFIFSLAFIAIASAPAQSVAGDGEKGDNSAPVVVSSTSSKDASVSIPAANATPVATSLTDKAKVERTPSQLKHDTEELLYRINLGRVEDVKLLIESGLPVDTVNELGVPILSLAAARTDSESEKIVKLLIENGADVGMTDKRGQTAVFYAARSNNTKALARLFAGDAKPAMVDYAGDSARDIATRLGNNDIVSMIDARVMKLNKEAMAKIEVQKNKLGLKDDNCSSGRYLSAEYGQLVNDLSFSSCALAYLRYAQANKYGTDFSDVQLQKNIERYGFNVKNYGDAYMNKYKSSGMMAQRIINVTTTQINRQLNQINSIEIWKKYSMGTVNDMSMRCHNISDVWQEALSH